MSSKHSHSKQSAAFEDLALPVRRWIWKKGISTLYDIQERAIRMLLDSENDLIIAAPTAGGKTEAAFLPLISSVIEEPNRTGFDLVYIGPLRALINDQFLRLSELCKEAEVPVYPWHGDISQSIKARARRNPRGILLITPESLEAFFVLRGLEVPALFSGAKAIVIDELHALLDSERGIHVRSLLTRLEVATGRRIRRVGLSATLGEMDMARGYLRPEAPEGVQVLESKGSQALKVQIRGYVVGSANGNAKAAGEAEGSGKWAVAEHLFRTLRGSSNLIFAGSRQNVEWYADALRQTSEKARVPVEFLPHHASLSRAHRVELEERLRSGAVTTAVCTSTLELGIDIGKIESIAQIGPPFSVASLRQRLGRSGRRSGQPAVLRMYAIENESSTGTHFLNRLHLDLIRCIAMVELLRERWCEPPALQALHLSTLVHQILSVIAERGGSRAKELYNILCQQGPFLLVDQGLFASVLRRLGNSEVALIEQAPDGTLLLGCRGERLVEHFSFYAVFQTQREFRIIASGKALGTLPVSTFLRVDSTIVFAGKRWRVTAVHDAEKVIEVVSDPTGIPPPFGGMARGIVHDRIVQKMRELLLSGNRPRYLDSRALSLLDAARGEIRLSVLRRQAIQMVGERAAVVATWVGTIKTSTLALVLRSMGYRVDQYCGFLEVSYEDGKPHIKAALRQIVRTKLASLEEVLTGIENLSVEKFHPYLDASQLIRDAASSRFDVHSMPALAQSIVNTVK